MRTAYVQVGTRPSLHRSTLASWAIHGDCNSILANICTTSTVLHFPVVKIRFRTENTNLFFLGLKSTLRNASIQAHARVFTLLFLLFYVGLFNIITTYIFSGPQLSPTASTYRQPDSTNTAVHTTQFLSLSFAHPFLESFFCFKE